MIDFQNITKTYGGEYILKDVNCRINSGERVGVVGPNGAGKSTLFGIITGNVVPDYGNVIIPKNHRLGIMHQRISPEALNRSLLEFTADAIPELKAGMRRLQEIEAIMEKGSSGDIDSLLHEHGELQTRVEHLGAYHLEQEAREALTSLGFPVDSFAQPLKSFSGGWQMRAALARVLISHPDTLMLDEPSNYLDVPAVEWLCRFLTNFSGTLLLISHDRFLLRKLAKITLEVNAAVVTRYAGNYDYYRREREQRQRLLEAAKRNTDHERERLERVIDRFKAKATKAAAAKSWQKKLAKIEEIELPNSLNYHGVIRFPTPPPCGTEAARFEEVSFGYSPEKLLFSDVTMDIGAGEKIAIIGYNGLGKTTLLKILQGILKPVAGRVVLGHHTVIGYQAQEFSELLNDELTVYDAVRGVLPAGAPAGDIANVLGSFGFSGEAINKPCGVLSGGERIRLQMARIFIKPPNFLVLDEPTTHLDIAARELLQEALKQYAGTVCMVSHDIEFVRGVATTIWALENHGVKKYFGNYDYYLEKRPPLASETTLVPNFGNGVVELTAKERRRVRAQARGAIAADLKRIKQLVANLETQLDEQSIRRSVLIAKLSSGEKVDFAKLKRELAEIEKQISVTESRWEESAAELEAIRLENDRIHQE